MQARETWPMILRVAAPFCANLRSGDWRRLSFDAASSTDCSRIGEERRGINKAGSSTSAFGPVPDIGHAEQFVRDGPITEVRGGRDGKARRKWQRKGPLSRATLLSTPLHA
jgi:hypothetical protein